MLMKVMHLRLLCDYWFLHVSFYFSSFQNSYCVNVFIGILIGIGVTWKKVFKISCRYPFVYYNLKRNIEHFFSTLQTPRDAYKTFKCTRSVYFNFYNKILFFPAVLGCKNNCIVGKFEFRLLFGSFW